MSFDQNRAFSILYSCWGLDQVQKALTPEGLQPEVADLTGGHFCQQNQAYTVTVAEAHPGLAPGDKLKLAHQYFD